MNTHTRWRRLETARSLLVCHMRPVFTPWHRNRGETNRQKKRRGRRAGEPEKTRQRHEQYRAARRLETFLRPSTHRVHVYVCVCSFTCVCVCARPRRVVLRIVARQRQPLCRSEHMVSDTSLSSAIPSVYTAPWQPRQKSFLLRLKARLKENMDEH